MKQNKIILEGERVRLEPLTLEHVEELYENGKYEEIWTFTTTKIATKEDAIQYIQSALDQKENGMEYPFAVYDKELKKYVGSTRFLNISLPNRNLEIGYTWYTPSVWRTRVNTECKYLLLTHTFEQLDMIRVQFKTDRRNERSHNAILRIGATHEGVLRKERILHDGYVRDTNVYSIIHSEWSNVKQKLESYLSIR